MEPLLFERTLVHDILAAVDIEKPLLFFIVGPRQVGKTTAALQIAKKWNGTVIKVSADEPLPPGPEWIVTHWNRARSIRSDNPLLILDEIQKVQGWSETIKRLWDEDVERRIPLRVLLLGSSSLQLQKGFNESLAGRYLLFRATHWNFRECRDAFDLSLEKWLYFGGYPGALSMVRNEHVWRQYIRDSLIEAVLSKDVLQMQNIHKPALLRHLFMFGASHPAHVISYSKMVGQLSEAGNTTTLAHYITILESAFLLSGLELFKRGIHKKRGSSPKLIAWNNALITTLSSMPFEMCLSDHAWWGHLVENAVGAHLLNTLSKFQYSVYYWQDRDAEVDFVVETPRNVYVLEVKSAPSKNPKGIAKFLEKYPDAIPLLIGGSGMPLDEFFLADPSLLFV